MRDTKPPFAMPTYSSPLAAPQTNQNVAKKLKQVVFIFDATAMMAPFSQIINQTYLAPLFRSFSSDSKQSPWAHEYAIVLFRDLPPHADYLVQCSSFTKDIKQFVTWCTSVKFGTGGYSSNAVCEGLCAAYRLAHAKHADERVFILFTNSSPNLQLPCRCCDHGDCMLHAKRIGAENIMLSIIAPRQIDALKEIFINSKPNTEVEETHAMGDKSYLTLLRGLVLPAANTQSSIASTTTTNANTPQLHPSPPPQAIGSQPPTSTTPITVSTVPASAATALPSTSHPGGAKTFWQGHLAWSTGQAGKAAPMLPLMAQAPPGADLSLYLYNEWPPVLHVSGVCSLSEPGIANHSKTAPFADFAQLPQSKLTAQEQTSFATFIRQLQINNWGAAVELPNRTMLIKPNNPTKGGNNLRAMIIPKLALKTQRPSQGQVQGQVQGQPQPNPQPQASQPIPSTVPTQSPPFVPHSLQQSPMQTIPNFSPSPSPTPMVVTPSPPTNISTPPTPPLSTSNQYIGVSRSNQSVPIANVAQSNLFSPTTTVNVNTRLPVGTNMRSPIPVGVLPTEGQMEASPSYETQQLPSQPNQQPQLQQIQQQLQQHLQQANMQYQQPPQQLQQLHQLHSPFQSEASLPAETGDEDDVVLLEVQPAKKLKPAPQGQRVR